MWRLNFPFPAAGARMLAFVYKILTLVHVFCKSCKWKKGQKGEFLPKMRSLHSFFNNVTWVLSEKVVKCSAFVKDEPFTVSERNCPNLGNLKAFE